MPATVDIQQLIIARMTTGQSSTDQQFDPALRIQLASDLAGIRTEIERLMNAGRVKKNDSFGFAIAPPDAQFHEIWDDPYALGWIVGGWGPHSLRYIANALRKMRAAARTSRDSLYLSRNERNWFQNVYQGDAAHANEDGTFPWGDFPWGGARFHKFSSLTLLGGVSALSEGEDDWLASYILGRMGLLILRSYGADI